MSKIQLITKELGVDLIDKIEDAATICILSSFVVKSGVQYLKAALKKAAQNGADIKMCTGDYLYITQPEALAELLAIDESIEIRIWKSNYISFHPKVYLKNDTSIAGDGS
ncbi:MAG: hypothetical protein AB2392_18030 [Neobacillus sp.]